MTKNEPILCSFVPGDSVYGKTSTSKQFFQQGILVLKSLELRDYNSVINSIGIICEQCQKTSHIIVVCRILGIPVVQVNSIESILDSKFLHINFNDNIIQFATQEFKVVAQTVECTYMYPRMIHQLSIVNSVDLIRRINTYSNGDVEQIFLRSELLWLSLQKNPFYFLNVNGIETTSEKICEQLFFLYKEINEHQVLNFRGLDLRSDQGLFEDAPISPEPNPHLGLHGTRQLLMNQEYLKAELKAVDALYDKGCNRVVYSLPFVISAQEVKEVIKLRNINCKHKIKMGVFIETPASVADIDSIIDQDILYIYLGTKDLSQLILAVDRDNSRVSHLMDMVSPPTVKAIKCVANSCKERNIPLYIFSMPSDIQRLIEAIPETTRISIPASDYFNHKEGYISNADS